MGESDTNSPKPSTRPQFSAEGSGGDPVRGYYGYAAYPEELIGNSRSNSLKDILQILRERIWISFSGFLIVFSTCLIYTFVATPIYRSQASVEVLRQAPTVMAVQEVDDSQVRTTEDINTQVNILSSQAIIKLVAARLKGDELTRFLAPYKRKDGEPVDILEILENHRTIVPERLSLVITIQYEHPDRQIAAILANYFADEYLKYTAKIRLEESMRAFDDLKKQADDQKTKVDSLALALQDYRERNNMVSLDTGKDIVTDKLKALNLQVTQDTATFGDAETKWKQVQTIRSSGGDLLSLPFIASVPAVSQLQQSVATAAITVTQLSQHYRSKYPKLIEANKSLAESQRQLNMAIETAAAQIQASYQTALQDYTKARSALASQESNSLNVDRYGVEYANLQRDFDVNEKFLEQMLERMSETASSSAPISTQTARLIDHAKAERKPARPVYLLYIIIGVFLSGGAGVGLAFLANNFDDRIKSNYDIETVISLPLLSVVPKFRKKRGSQDEMADTSLKQWEILEAFATLHSSLQLRPGFKEAHCLLVTSTIPGEGKSFITANLAKTLASHNDRTLLIDCDLRRPTIHRLFGIKNEGGVIQVCTGSKTVDDFIKKDCVPNLDVLPAGGRSKSPAQHLHSDQFAELLKTLRTKYDRIVIDTPPISLVSDALLILPLTDGSIYSIFFNRVKRKAAQFCVQRMKEVNVPHFGVVLNGLDQSIGGYYYNHYYNRTYSKYYAPTDD